MLKHAALQLQRPRAVRCRAAMATGVGGLAGFATTSSSGEALLLVGLVARRERKCSLLALPATPAGSADTAAIDFVWVNDLHLREPTTGRWATLLGVARAQLSSLEEAVLHLEDESIYEEARSTESDGATWRPAQLAPSSSTSRRSTAPARAEADESALGPLAAIANAMSTSMKEQSALLAELVQDKRKGEQKVPKAAPAGRTAPPPGIFSPAPAGPEQRGQQLLAAAGRSRHQYAQPTVEDDDLEDISEEEADSDLEDQLIQAAGRGRAQSSNLGGTQGDMNSMIQLQMLRALKKMDRKSRSSSDDDSREGSRDKDGAGGFAGLQRLRSKVRKQPLKVLRRYREDVCKMKRLWRCHHLLSDILQQVYRYKKSRQELRSKQGVRWQPAHDGHEGAVDDGDDKPKEPAPKKWGKQAEKPADK
jgi:hypothetical protein